MTPIDTYKNTHLDAIHLAHRTLDCQVNYIAFHSLVGVEHTFVYDLAVLHSEALNMTGALKRLVDNGWATVVRWPLDSLEGAFWENKIQLTLLDNCLYRFGPKTTWLVNPDLDEMLQPLGEFETLPQMLQKYTNGTAPGRSRAGGETMYKGVSSHEWRWWGATERNRDLNFEVRQLLPLLQRFTSKSDMHPLHRSTPDAPMGRMQPK